MTVFICVDDRGGMAFNGRCQSRDRVLRQDMLTEVGGEPLWMEPGAGKQFTEEADLRFSADYLTDCGEEGFCFVQRPPLEPFAKKIHRLVVYRWNRAYPADCYLDLQPEKDWRLESRTEFAGSSHDKITKEVYVQ